MRGHAPAGLVLEDDLDGDVVRDLDPHQLAERAFVGVDVDEPLVDAHLPVLPRSGPLTVRPQKPLSIEPSSEIPELGSFAVRDMGQTIAAGKVLSVDER